MVVNANKPHRWKADVAHSVDFYNEWFIRFAPAAYRQTRIETTDQVEFALNQTENLTRVTPVALRENPSVLSVLRMTTAPPIARDRLIGLAQVTPSLVSNMELQDRMPPRMDEAQMEVELTKICDLIMQLADGDIFPWLESGQNPNSVEVHRAATIVADRLCGAVANPIIRNAQEQRQLVTLRAWLENRGYIYLKTGDLSTFDKMRQGTFTFRLNVPVVQEGRSRQVNLPIDVVVMPKRAQKGDLPLLIEAKSAGDFTNVNKRRKEEATKAAQLRSTYGENIRFVLFLCGYFDSGYLGYEAAEGIDWVWEHRLDDLAELGL